MAINFKIAMIQVKINKQKEIQIKLNWKMKMIKISHDNLFKNLI